MRSEDPCGQDNRPRYRLPVANHFPAAVLTELS